jgi:outer membrane protein insertion porin family
VNNLAKKLFLRTYITPLLILIALIFSSELTAQNLDFNNGKRYTIGDIAVTGNTSFSSQTVVAY